MIIELKMNNPKFWTGAIILIFFLSGAVIFIPDSNAQDQGEILDNPIRPKSSEASISLEWVSIFDQHPYESVYAVATDSFGDVYLVGDCDSDSMDFDILLAKYHKNGSLLWSRQWNQSVADSGFDIAIDSHGDIYVVGNSYRGNILPCIVKFDKNGKDLGNHTWNALLGYRSYGVALDSKDNVYITGNGVSHREEYGNLIWNSFLIKYNSTLDPEWELMIPQSLSSDIVVDTEDNVYIAGSFHADTYDIVRKFSCEGVSLENITWHGEEHISVNAMVIDIDNNIYITGTNITISEGNMKGAMMVLKYSPEGIFQWMSSWHNGFNDESSAFDLCLDSIGNIYLTGRASNLTTFDSILLQYNRTGNLVYTSQWDNQDYDSSFGIAIDNSSDDLYITGASHDFGDPNTDAFILKYNNSVEFQDSIPSEIGNNESTKNGSNSQNNNKPNNSINGYNLALILLSIGIISILLIKINHFKVSLQPNWS